MAIKLVAGEDMKRSDLFYIDPWNILIQEDLRGRHIPPTEEQVIELAESLITYGQQQPVKCRRTADQRPLLVAGFTRTAAARLIREGFTDTNGTPQQDAGFMLQVTLTDYSDQQSFVSNITENAARNQVSVIDDAFNQHRLRERYGYSDADIARLYSYKGQAKVTQLRRLLLLPEELQLQVHTGELTISAAIEVSELPEDIRQDIAEASKTTEGKVVATRVREEVRKRQLNNGQVQEHHLRDDGRELPPASTPKRASRANKPLTLREVREFIAELGTEFTEPEIHSFVYAFTEFINGKVPGTDVIQSLRNICSNSISGEGK